MTVTLLYLSSENTMNPYLQMPELLRGAQAPWATAPLSHTERPSQHGTLLSVPSACETRHNLKDKKGLRTTGHSSFTIKTAAASALLSFSLKIQNEKEFRLVFAVDGPSAQSADCNLSGTSPCFCVAHDP